MDVCGSVMEVNRPMIQQRLRYSQFIPLVANRLGRDTIPGSTFSRWMRQLGYPKGRPGLSRWWDAEDLEAFVAYGQGLSLGMSCSEAKQYTDNQVNKWREANGLQQQCG